MYTVYFATVFFPELFVSIILVFANHSHDHVRVV